MAFTSSYRSEGLALVIGYDQVGIHLRYFLCNQSELRRAFRVQLFLIAERDGWSARIASGHPRPTVWRRNRNGRGDSVPF